MRTWILAGSLAAFSLPREIGESSAAPRGVGASHTFLIELSPTRPNVFETLTAAEQKGLLGHMQRIPELASRGTVIFGGRTGSLRALLVVDVADLATAKTIAAADPAVVAGVFTAEVSDLDVRVSSALGEHSTVDPSDRVVACDALVDAPLDRVWHAWTSSDGWRAAMPWKATIECRIGGRFEVEFDDAKAPGERGSEGCRVLCFVPKQMIAFEWNAPPSFAALRFERTQVAVRFEAVGAAQTRVWIAHAGFGKDAEHQKVADYFVGAWPAVLGEMQKHFATKR